MPYDLSSSLVPVFPGINDSPVAPTESKGGNGSHLVGVYNELITSLQSALNTLDSKVNNLSKYTILSESTDYSVSSGELLIVENSGAGFASINILLPVLPAPGTWFSVLNFNAAITIDFLNFDKYRGSYPLRIFFNNDSEEIKLIYVNSDYGWMPDKLEVIQTEFGGS